jgi:PadR family transcriptional regulator PadR
MTFKGDLRALILAVLADSDLHGYEILKQIRERSGQVFKYGESKLYPALHALELDGFIAAEWVEQAGKPDRKVYHLTPTGQGKLEEHRATWVEFSAGVAGLFGPSEVRR